MKQLNVAKRRLSQVEQMNGDPVLNGRARRASVKEN